MLDPMLATGGSAIAAVDVLKQWGVSRIKFVGLLGAPRASQRSTNATRCGNPCGRNRRAADRSGRRLPGYIWPGLGDAGDRQFGTA